MPFASKTRCASLLVGVVAALAGAPLRGGPAAAGDDAGVREFIASEAARTAVPEPGGARVVASSPIVADMKRYFVSPRRVTKTASASVQRAPAPARHPRVQYAKLPAPEARSTPKPQKPVVLPSDPVEALLRDPTLQPGDVVVLRDGPKVFSGHGKFEPVEQSRLLSKRARKVVLAMVPPATHLAGQARQKLAFPTPTSSEGVPFASAVRVVYPPQ